VIQSGDQSRVGQKTACCCILIKIADLLPSWFGLKTNSGGRRTLNASNVNPGSPRPEPENLDMVVAWQGRFPGDILGALGGQREQGMGHGAWGVGRCERAYKGEVPWVDPRRRVQMQMQMPGGGDT